MVQRGIVYFRFCGFGLMFSDGGVMVAVVGLGIRFGDRVEGWTDGRMDGWTDGRMDGWKGAGGGGLYRYKLGQSGDYFRGKRREEEMWQCLGMIPEK